LTARYVPKRGDLVWLDFTPHSGHEQAGRRPAVVLSPLIYNRETQLMLCCPITSRVKGYPFEVSVSARTISGVILADQIKSVDWVARHARYAGKVNPETVHAVLDRVRTLLEEEV